MLGPFRHPFLQKSLGALRVGVHSLMYEEQLRAWARGNVLAARLNGRNESENDIEVLRAVLAALSVSVIVVEALLEIPGNPLRL